MHLTDAFGSEYTVTPSEHTVKLFRITNVMRVITRVNTCTSLFTAAYGSSANVCTGFTSNYMLLGRDAYKTFVPISSQMRKTQRSSAMTVCHPAQATEPALTLTSGRK